MASIADIAAALAATPDRYIEFANQPVDPSI